MGKVAVAHAQPRGLFTAVKNGGAPTLLHELRTGENDVKRLVLSIVCEQAQIVRSTQIQPFLIEIERFLTDDDRLVRMAAVRAVRDLLEHRRGSDVASPIVVASLRRIGSHDELPLAREALLTLLEMNDGAVREIGLLAAGSGKRKPQPAPCWRMPCV